MGIMGFLRDRMGKILAFFIGFALLAFIIGEVVRSGGSFFRDDRNLLGEASGEKIAYDDFKTRVDQNSAQFKQQGQPLSPQATSYVEVSTWNQMVSRAIIDKEIDKLDLVVGTDETNAMIHGNNPDRQIVQAFTDPKTGRFDPNSLNTFLSNLQASKADDPRRQQWSDFLTQMIESKLSEKYVSLVTNGIYVNSLDAKDDYQNKNRLANFKYVTLDYASVPDNKITVTDDDYQSYYNEHKAEFKNPEELRTFEYVSFNAAPSKDDSAASKTQAEKIAAEFKTTNNDSLFVQINAETKAPLSFQHKGRTGLDPKVDSIMFSAAKGFVYGPFLSNGKYKIAKLVDAHVEPDSVKARHILIDDKTIGVEKAIAKADSIKKLIQGGKSFADLANMYSIDKNSAVKGGDLGTFGRGAMIPVFEDAVFEGKKGDLKVVPSQFGVHLIEIEDQKGSSKVAKVAVVDLPLKASSATQTIVYSNAQKFLGSLTKDNFDEQVKKESLTKKTAADVNGIAGAVIGIENAREIVRWAFAAEKGDFSDKVYISGDQYIVARLSEIKPKGTLSLEAVKKQIEPMVKNRVKGKVLSDKLQSALNGSSNIDQVAQKAGGKVVPIQNIVFANPVIPGASAEFKVIGTVFGSQPNKISKPIEGQQGVFVFVVDSFVNPAPLTNTVREREQLGQTLLQRADNQIFDALKDKANVKDYRAKFL
jgi:peptidyl-prolyl cis-trans isomerase D